MAVYFTYEQIPARPEAQGQLACFLIGTGLTPGAGKSLIDLDTPYLVHRLTEAQALGDGSESVGTDGTLLATLEAIYDSINCPVVVMRMDETLNKLLPTPAGSPFTLKAIELINRWSSIDSEEYQGSAIGVRPRLGVDSGLVEDADDDISSAIAEAWATESAMAHGIPIYSRGGTVTTIADFGVWYDANAHAQVGRTLPLLLASVTDAAGSHTGAGAVAGAIVRSVRDNGLVKNPELEPVLGITTFTPQFPYSTSPSSPAQSAAFPASSRNATLLIRHRGGILTYGMILATTDNDDPLRFVSTRLVADIIDEDMSAIAERYQGRPSSQKNIDKLETDLSEYLEFRETQGLTRRGSYTRQDTEHNTPTNIAAGDIEYDSVIRFFGSIRDVHIRTQATLRPVA